MGKLSWMDATDRVAKAAALSISNVERRARRHTPRV